MATSKEYKDFILEQLDLLDSISGKIFTGFCIEGASGVLRLYKYGFKSMRR